MEGGETRRQKRPKTMVRNTSSRGETSWVLTEKTFQPPTIISEWKVSLALSLTLSNLKALRALNAPTALDTAPSFDNCVMTLIQKVMSTMASMNPHELLKYAFGV